MTQYAIIKPGTNEVHSFVTYAGAEPPVVDGFTVEALTTPIVGYPQAPFDQAVLTIESGALVWRDDRTLEQARAQAWERIKAARDGAELAPFTCNGHVFDGDAAATRRITGATNGAMMAAMAGQPFSKDFTLADNTSIALDGPAMMAVGAALIGKVGAVFETGRTLRKQIDAASTIAALDAIIWPQG